MKKITRKTVALAVAACMMVPACAGLAACGGGSADSFTIWISPNSALWEEYQDLTLNPVIQYLDYKFDIDLQFQIPISGSEKEQFTVLTTGTDCPDVMDLSYYSGSVTDLVEDGVAVDLTEYIYPESGESLFPNYAGYLDKTPDVKSLISSLDHKFPTLYTIDDALRAPWGGYMYRKDLVFKYKSADDKFTLDGKEVNPATWQSEEDIVFPSGAKAPDLISDYDWLFQVLQRAVDAGELDYCTSIFYPGYLETGDIVSAWGISASWYKTVENGKTVVKYGGMSDEFKEYIKKIKEWYDKGYIDKDFSSRTNDMFFAINSESYTRGRTGCFYGTDNLLGNLLATAGDDVDQNIDMRAAYMPRLSKDMEPTVFYAATQINRNLMVTSSAMNKNYEKLFAALDYLYGEEGSLLTRFGLNKEQYAELKDAGVTNFWDAEVNLTQDELALAGVTESTQKLSDIGVYHLDEASGKYVYWSDIETDYVKQGYEMCASAMCFWGLAGVSKMKYMHMSDARYEAQYEIWTAYEPTGNIDMSYPAKLTSEENSDYVINYNSLTDYMATEVPKFIKGTKSLDSDWKSFCNSQIMKGCNKNLAYLQKIFDALA